MHRVGNPRSLGRATRLSGTCRSTLRDRIKGAHADLDPLYHYYHCISIAHQFEPPPTNHISGSTCLACRMGGTLPASFKQPLAQAFMTFCDYISRTMDRIKMEMSCRRRMVIKAIMRGSSTSLQERT